ncbi:MAG: LysR family transcriptional regulator [Myxococcota bacterium]
MATARLEQTNLNLLLALDALLRESSVSRAAERLGVSQPAMSQTLRQLRQLLDDPILVRSGAAMVATPRAELLAGPLRRGLVELDRVLSGDVDFDPARSRRRFTVAMGDSTVVAVPALLQRLGQLAPEVDIDVVRLDLGRYPGALAAGELDAVVTTSYDRLERGLVSATLYQESFRCLTRAGHPEVELDPRGRITLDRFLALPHALISPRGEGPGVVDTLLQQIGKQRRIALRIPYFLAAPLIVARSELILTAPTALARSFADLYPLDLFLPPLDLPSHEIVLVWHRRYDRDPANLWFRQQITAVATDYAASHGAAQ